MSNSLAAKTQLRDIGTKFFRLFQPPPLMTVDEWADEFRELSTVSSAKGGRWRTRSYQREPMRVMTERTVRSVCICGAAQIVGKSEMLFNFIGRQIHLNPGPILLVEPTNDLAERVSKKRLQPMFEITPALRPLVAEQKSRATANTIRAKTFPGGTLNISGANTPNELCSDPIRDVLIDEVDRCNEAAGKEGDIVTLAEQRQGSFGKNAFSLYVSTPSGKKPRAKGETQPVGVSKILVLLNESDNRHRFCPCQKCGHEQELLWAQFQWRDGDVKNTRFYCASCDHPHTEQERRKMIDEGRWVALNPSVTDRAGFFLPGMYSLSDPDRGSDTMMEQMARNFLRAKHRGKEALRAWVNTFLCECFADDEDAEQPEGTLLLAKREPYGETIPKDVLLITVGVDVQAGDKNKRGRLEAHIVGWAENEVPWVLDYQVFAGDPEHPSTWAQLESFIANTTYITEDGRELIMERVAVDSGHVPDTVYAFCQPRGVRMIKGKMQRVIADFRQKVQGIRGITDIEVSYKEGTPALSVRLKPELAALAPEMEGKVKVAFIDCDAEGELAGAFGVRGIPALFLMKDGEIIDSWTGYMPRAAVKARRDFSSADYSPLHIERHLPFSHRRISLASAYWRHSTATSHWLQIATARRVAFGRSTVGRSSGKKMIRSA